MNTRLASLFAATGLALALSGCASPDESEESDSSEGAQSADAKPTQSPEKLRTYFDQAQLTVTRDTYLHDVYQAAYADEYRCVLQKPDGSGDGIKVPAGNAYSVDAKAIVYKDIFNPKVGRNVFGEWQIPLKNVKTSTGRTGARADFLVSCFWFSEYRPMEPARIVLALKQGGIQVEGPNVKP